MAKTKTSKHKHQHRYGHHQKHTRSFLSVYAPYIPLMAIILSGLFLGFRWESHNQPNVLGKAVSVSTLALKDETNVERLGFGLEALSLNEILSQAAQAKANDMAEKDYWSHDTPDGRSPWSFVTAAGYNYTKAGENLAYGFATSRDVINGWMNSPSHKENVLGTEYTEVGFGIADVANYQNSGPQTIVVAMYGARLLNDSDQAIVTRSNPIPSEQTVVAVSRSQTIFANNAQLVLLAAWTLSGFGIIFTAMRHIAGLRRFVTAGETFVIQHPIFDITMISFIAFSYALSQTVGFVL